MRTLSYSYQRIFNIAFPLILGNLAYTAIGFSDMYFMKFVGPIEQGAISYVGHLYTTIFIMGYAYGKGVQILVANQAGAGAWHKVGNIVDHAILALLLMAVVLAVSVHLLGYDLLSGLLKTPEAVEASWQYLSVRKIGFVFAFMGCVMLSMYSGIERTKILALAIVSMSATNIFLNWVFVFGKFGMKPMGIIGAAWASNLAELVSLFIFVVGAFHQRLISKLKLFRFKGIHQSTFSHINWISLPLILQAFIALSAWFLFFTLIERELGPSAWAASGAISNIYMLCGITTYAFASTTNTAIGNLIGKQAYEEIVPTVRRIIGLSFGVAIVVTMPVLFSPKTVLLTLTTPELMEIGYSTLYVAMFSLWMYSIGSILFNAIVGLGQTMWSLVIEIASCIAFVGLLLALLYAMEISNLALSWLSEVNYWLFTGGLGIYWFMKKFPKVIRRLKEQSVA